jgi:hypothetical protein
MFGNLYLFNGEEFKLGVMISIISCTLSNILSYFDMGRFIKLYKLQYSEVLNVLSCFC